MASAEHRIRPEKEAMLAELRQRLEGASYIFLADYTGLDMQKTLELRKRLRASGARMQVARNRLVQRAARGLEFPPMDAGLKGPTAMVLGSGDAAEAAKALIGFIDFNKQVPVLKMGALGRNALTAADIRSLAALPSRTVLLSMFLGTLGAPMTSLAGLLYQKLASVLYVLKAVQNKREQESAAA